MIRRSKARRTSTVVSEYDSKATLAAATALSTSDAVPSEMIAMASSLAGLMTW
jgi:hypothetical protein